jgi:hypothetical protein
MNVHTKNGVIAPFFGVIKIQCGVIISHVLVRMELLNRHSLPNTKCHIRLYSVDKEVTTVAWRVKDL